MKWWWYFCYECYHCFHGYCSCCRSNVFLPLRKKSPWLPLMEIECLALSLILPSPILLWLFSTETGGDCQARNTHTGTQVLNSQNGGMHLPKIYNFMPGANIWLYFPPARMDLCCHSKNWSSVCGKLCRVPSCLCWGKFNSKSLLIDSGKWLSLYICWFFSPQIFTEHLLCVRHRACHEECNTEQKYT